MSFLAVFVAILTWLFGDRVYYRFFRPLFFKSETRENEKSIVDKIENQSPRPSVSMNKFDNAIELSKREFEKAGFKVALQKLLEELNSQEIEQIDGAEFEEKIQDIAKAKEIKTEFEKAKFEDRLKEIGKKRN